MNDDDRRRIQEALKNERTIDRILATFNSFKNWMMLTLYVIYLKVQYDLKGIWRVLKLAFR